MLYLLAVILPPLAVLMAGKPFQALINVVLTLCLWVPGMIHALFVAHNHYADKRTQRMIDGMAKAQAVAQVMTPPRVAPASGALVAPAAAGGQEFARETKVCPRCAETVLAAAKVCRFCSHDFEPLEPSEAPA